MVTVKDHCTVMVLLDSSLMSQSGSRKDEPVGAWFSEPPNKELGTPKNVFLNVKSMANFLEFEIPGQGKVLVKPLTELPQGAALASRGGISAQASKTFAESLKGLPEIAQNVFSAVKATATPPSEIEVDFNVAFSGEADLVIVSGNAEASLSVKLTWNGD